MFDGCRVLHTIKVGANFLMDHITASTDRSKMFRYVNDSGDDVVAFYNPPDATIDYLQTYCSDVGLSSIDTKIIVGDEYYYDIHTT